MVRLTRNQVRQIDRLSVERYHIPGEVLMENAAIAAANVAASMVSAGDQGEILILCGGGNNGGDGLAIARHLHNRQFKVKIFLAADPGKYVNEAKTNWRIVQAMGLPISLPSPQAIESEHPILVVDAIFGTGLTQEPRDPFPQIVAAVQKIGAPVLAIDIPSGLDCDTGLPLGSACIKARRTITFAAEKVGFVNPRAREYLGEVTVGDIGCPRELVMEAANFPA
ncbi:MAG TPA: NAD(P)H-hydrate epimerase [Tepidisphaeraceae bacterium]